jgi:hypothetical protein
MVTLYCSTCVPTKEYHNMDKSGVINDFWQLTVAIGYGHKVLYGGEYV